MSQYRCIEADPPWAERGGGKIKRGADRHYPLMNTPEIAKVMMASPLWRPADNAHLWLWVTDNFLEDGLGVMRTLGFEYIRTFVWVKLSSRTVDAFCGNPDNATVIDVATAALQVGLGQYARGSHELCLLGARGAAMVPLPQNRPPSVIFATRSEHSAKPDLCYSEWFERVSPGPRLSMFSRKQRPHWDVWGNEVP